VKKPTTTTSNHRLDYYNAGDFYVGATLEFNRHRFVLIDADEYAFNYMEQHRDQVCALSLSPSQVSNVSSRTIASPPRPVTPRGGECARPPRALGSTSV